MWLAIKPLDVLMFRDGKPFNAGDQHDAQTLFPPTAFPIQGALRALYIEESGIGWHNLDDIKITSAIGDTKQLGQFRFKGPYLARQQDNFIERVFPFPADLVKGKKDKVWRALNPRADMSLTVAVRNIVVQSYALDVDDTKEEEPPKEPLWLSEETFVDYLKFGEVGVSSAIPQADLFAYEYRTGIELNASMRHVEEGQLYSAKFVRLQEDVMLLVQLSDNSPLVSLLAKGQTHTIRLGGEGRSAKVFAIDDSTLELPLSSQVQPTQGNYKIVFLTPTYFEYGCLPKAQQHTWQASFISAQYGDAFALGGWNAASNRPRSMYRYLPAGSVMYLRRTNGAVLQSPLTDQPPDALPVDALGFGEFVYGHWGK